MIQILMAIYAASVIVQLTLIVLEIKNLNSICIGDLVLSMAIIFTPILNTVIIAGLIVDKININWLDILEKEIWTRK
jgi:hypothetical protein